MDTTLHDGEKLLITNIHGGIKENDIIVFHQTGSLNEPVVKRVIATGNRYVKIDYNTRTLYVSDDSIFDENDIVDENGYAYFDTGSYKMKGTLEIFVPQGFLFVLGDNRNNSTDSRSELIGLVDERTVLGKVVFRFTPSDKIGFIK
jgi:signal peptidase I